MTHLDTGQLFMLFGQGFLPRARVMPSTENSLAIEWLKQEPSLGDPYQIMSIGHPSPRVFEYLLDQFVAHVCAMTPLELDAYQKQLMEKI